MAFCPNSFDAFSSKLQELTGESFVSPPCSVSQGLAAKRVADQKPQETKSSLRRTVESRPLQHKIRGEEPADEMRRKGVGEEPTVALTSSHRRHSCSFAELYVLELFAGTARLTKCFRKHGFQAMAFDKTSKRSEGQVILESDLSNREEVESLLDFLRLKASQIAVIHMAPPCGTASRARGKRVKLFKKFNIHEPMPLRDDQYPDGFPWLKGSDKMRTETANILYEHTALIARTADELSIAFTIENPSNSLMWKTSAFQSLLQLSHLKLVHFHNCAHGGTRDKKTAFLTNVDWFDSLEVFCNRQHSHAPWTPTVVNGRAVFPTHSEAAYPEILCQRFASLVKNRMLEQGACDVEDIAQHVRSSGKSLNRVVLGALPRGRHVKPLVSEFGTYVHVVHDVQSDDLLQSFLATLPKGSSVQTRLVTKWGSVRDAMDKQIKKRTLAKKLQELKALQANGPPVDSSYEQIETAFGCSEGSSYKLLGQWEYDDDLCEKVTIAIPREPLDFLNRAVEAGHPRSVAINLPPELQSVMQWNRDAEAYVIYKQRIEFVKFWSAKANELAMEDERLLHSAPAHLASILKGKRLALWQSMLEYYDYPDKELVRDIARGFPIMGWLPDSQVFPRDFRPPQMTVDTLKAVSKGLNERVRAKVLASASSDLTTATWEETERELAENWMELDSSGGSDAAWAMRFGLQQKDKVRVIDDFSIAGVNHTTGLQERLKIFGIDDVAALLAYSIDTFDGEKHPTMLGKTMDLKSAYKQFGINAGDRTRIRVATTNPSTSELVLLMVNALPFGATGSVSAFFRGSMFLWFLGVVGLKLASTSFYDDYTLISREDCSRNAAWAAECLFDLLGIVFAKEGKKATSFDRIFGALGVVFDLSCINDKFFSLSHTESRRSELVETLSELVRGDSFTSKSLERLRGRLLWFENFVCGRQANSLIARLGKFVNNTKGDQPLVAELRKVLGDLLDRVQNGRPVEVCRRILSTWICFTDGACESFASIGGVLIAPDGHPAFVFGDQVPEELRRMLYLESKHPIYEVELLPLLVCACLWGDHLAKSQVVFYLDNDAARSGLIKGAGATNIATAIIDGFCLKEAELQLKTWFSRVPSHSNVSDGPSRLDFAQTSAMGFTRCQIPWSDVERAVNACLGRNGAMAVRD